MRNSVLFRLRLSLMAPATALAVSMHALPVDAQTPLYSPIPFPSNSEVSDSITAKDIPTGQGGFARDYLVKFETGDQVVMDLTSDEFDTILTLIAPDGSTAGENDDAPDGSTNSTLFVRITRPGDYILRVSPYAGQGMGRFNLKVTRLRPI
jgi:hypothetical protein